MKRVNRIRESATNGDFVIHQRAADVMERFKDGCCNVTHDFGASIEIANNRVLREALVELNQ